MSDQETEISLGVGRMLGLFFALVVVCAVFFVLGYSLGKNNAQSAAAANAATATTGSTAAKPAATQGETAQADYSSIPQPSSQMTSDAAQEMAATEVASPREERPEPVQRRTAPSRAPEIVRAPAPAPSAAFHVQVAAVSKKQDAEALAAALKRKRYKVFVASQTADNLFHVQVGPFSDQKEAEAIRKRLIADGYSPILKK